MSRRARVLAGLALSAAAALLAGGCLGGGGDDEATPPEAPAVTAPAAARPIAVSAVAPGEPVRAGSSTPPAVARALAGTEVVVIAFLVDGPADDRSVAAALREVRASGDSSRGVRYFVYRVGTGRAFGDLADLLAVQGTPSVAVIARDRTLQNLWTGVVDAGILRQSISDAKATAAANAGAGPRAGARAATALARKVNAAYRSVPGVEATGTVSVEGLGSLEVSATLPLRGGRAGEMSATYTLAGARVEHLVNPGGAYLRSSEARCWASLPAGAPVDLSPAGPVIDLATARAVAVRGTGRRRLLDVELAGERATYAVDARTHRVTRLRVGATVMSFRALTATPTMPDPAPTCDNPADALDGIPARLFPGGGPSTS